MSKHRGNRLTNWQSICIFIFAFLVGNSAIAFWRGHTLYGLYMVGMSIFASIAASLDWPKRPHN